MKKTIALLLTMCMIGACLTVGAAEPVEAQFLYVSPDGADTNSGSVSAPLATVSAAVEKANQMDGTVVINLRQGEYSVDQTVEISRNDLVIRSYPGEKATLTGGASIAYSAFQAISQQDAARLVDQKARTKVLAADLASLGITEYGQLYVFDHGFDTNPNAPALFVNDKSMTLSRYPNDGYLLTGKVLQEGDEAFSLYYNDKSWPSVDEITEDMVFKFQCSDSHLKQWGQANDIWVFGYWKHDWAEGRMGASVDPETGIVTSKYPAGFGAFENRRFYFYNLLEEIDQPEEWYLDRETGMLYLYPPADWSPSSTVEFVTFYQPFFDVSNTKNVTIQGIHMTKSVGKGIVGDQVEGLLINDCEISNVSGSGIEITGGSNCKVQNSYLHDLGAKGVAIDGGDRNTLTPGNNVVENNEIARFGQIKTTYNPGVIVYGVGNTIRHNEIYDTPHMAVGYSGNDHVIEYNEIYDVCKDTSDSGAIYIGRDWSTRGNVIRYNYFHDLEMTKVTTSYEMQAVYLDDMHSSTEVYNNIFYKCDSVALFGGGRNNAFVNNLMLECKKPFVLDSRGTTWAESGEGSQIRNNLLAVPYQSEAWSKYPNLADILEDDPELPKYNVIRNNVLYKTPVMDIADNALRYGTVENNIEITKTTSFADYKNKDFTVLPDSDITKKIADWTEIPVKEIGRKEYTVEDNYKEKSSNQVVLAIGTAFAFVNGTKTTMDPQNSEVQPIVQNDRTLVPVRFIAESFGVQVDWEEATQTVTITLDGVVTTLVIGFHEMKVGDKRVTLDVPAQTLHDRTLLPLRAICEEALGKTVFWDDAGLIVISDESVTVDVADWLNRLK